jgi:hypothetical protein
LRGEDVAGGVVVVVEIDVGGALEEEDAGLGDFEFVVDAGVGGEARV